MGTPRRRRATIVSANLITPRRHRRPSGTPQNTLRILSRALAKQVVEQPPENEISDQEEHRQATDQYDIQGDYAEFDFQEDLDRQYEDNIGEVDAEHRYSGSKSDNEKEITDPYSPGDIEQQRRLSISHSDRFSQPGLSDIALPVGIMPDNDLDLAPFSDPFQFDLHPEPEALPMSSFVHEPNTKPVKTTMSKPHPRPKTAKLQLPKKSTNPINAKNLWKFAETISKKSLNKDAITTLQQTSNCFFTQITSDLEAYTRHSKNKEVISIKSAYLLLKRQRQIDSIDSLLETVDELLPLEEVLELRRNLYKLQK